MDRFLVSFLVSTFDAIILRHAARLTGELVVSGHPIEVLM
jgi:hypothetical protein